MKHVWLVGASEMAQEYIRVLKALKVRFEVIGRGKSRAKECEDSTGCSVHVGGLECYLGTKPVIPSHAIVSVGVESLFGVTQILLDYGIKYILVEKPGALYIEEFEYLLKLSRKRDATVFIAYNRRFYASALRAQEIITQDKGVSSFHFEFTEWAHIIEGIEKTKEVKEKWFLANSTHVVDMAFHLGGKPQKMQSYTRGTLAWHPSASNFSGAGVSETGALFSYQANWESAGRWGVEILTQKHRLIFRPMEKLQIQKKGSITSVPDENIDYSLDEKFKPGVFLQTKAFLAGEDEALCGIEEQCQMLGIYFKMANYINE